MRPSSPRSARLAIAVALAFSGSLSTLAPLLAHAEQALQRYDIAAQPLEQTLRQIARQSGRSIVADPALVHGRNSAAVHGQFSAEAAAQQALNGSGLALRITENGTLTVEQLPDAGAAVQLGTTSIDASANQSAFAPVPGYFASNASSASKTDKPILETAQSISVVTAQQIADRKVDRVEDAVAYSAGVRVGASGLDPRFDTISVRGFPTTESADFLDGLRQAGSGWLSLPSVEAYSLERIEVLKGPSSVLYGQISPGGMVNRVSKRPSLLAKNEVEIQGGNYDHKQGQFDIGGKLDEDGDVLFRTVGLYRDAEYSIEQMDNNARLLAPSLSWQIDPDTSLTLLAQYEERQTAGSPMTYQDGDHLTSFWPGDEHFDKLDQRKWTVGYEFEHTFNDTFSVQQNLRYGQLNTTNQYLNFSTTDGQIFDRSTAGSYEDMSSLSTDSRLVSRFATGALQHTLVTGLDYAWTDTSLLYATGDAPSIDRSNPDYHQPVARPDVVGVDRDGLLFRSGVYVADQMELEQWRFSAGLRRDWVHQRSNGMEWGSEIEETLQHYADTTGSVGVLYLFDNGLAPYASYATSFLPQSGSPYGGGQFAPSEGEQYEVGLKYQPPGTSALFTASLYHLTQSHVLTPDLAHTGFSVETGEQVSKGLELEAVADLTDNLRLNASYSYNSPEVTKSNDGNKGKDPRDVPHHLASLWLDYSLPFGLGFGAGARYTGSTYGDDMNIAKNDDYTLFDAGVHYDFNGSLDGVRLAWNARNLTDERYVNCQQGYCYRGEARSLVTSLSYSW